MSNLRICILLNIHLYILWIKLPTSLQQPEPEKSGDSCNYVQLEDLCTTLWIALSCNVTPYCTHCIWNTAFVPIYAVDSKCAKCKESVLLGKQEITNEEEYTTLLSKTCKFHLFEEDITLCMELIQKYSITGFIRDAMDGNISAHDTCALLGMCYSPFAVDFKDIPPDEEIETSATIIDFEKSDQPVAMEKVGGGARGGGSRGGTFKSGGGSKIGSSKGWGSKGIGIGGKSYSVSNNGRTLSSLSAGKTKGATVNRIGKGNEFMGSFAGPVRHPFLPVFIPHYGGNVGGRSFSPTSKYSCQFEEIAEDTDYLWWIVIITIAIVFSVFIVIQICSCLRRCLNK